MTIVVIVILALIIALLVYKLYTTEQSIKNFSTTSIYIGRVNEFSKQDEDLLSVQKDALKYVVKYLDYKIAKMSEGLTDMKRSDQELRSVQKSILSMLEVRNVFTAMLNKKIDLK